MMKSRVSLLTGRWGLPALLTVVLLLFMAGPVHGESQTGIASWYGPGNGVASQWCTWTLRHQSGCGTAKITSLETGITTYAPVIDWCQCYRGTAQERIIDLQWGVVESLGLPISQGLYPVRVEWLTATTEIPDTAMGTGDMRWIFTGLGVLVMIAGLLQLIEAIRWEWSRQKLIQSDRFKNW
jgi:hypothetical protein